MDRVRRMAWAAAVALAVWPAQDLFAQPGDREPLRAQGWREITPGVFEKRSGRTVERLSFGAEGRTSTLSDLKRRYNRWLGQQRETGSDRTRTLRTLQEAITALEQAVTAPPAAASACSTLAELRVDTYEQPSLGATVLWMAADYSDSCGRPGFGSLQACVYGGPGGSECRSEEGQGPVFHIELGTLVFPGQCFSAYGYLLTPDRFLERWESGCV